MRRAVLLSALTIATAGIVVGALGPGLEAGDGMWPFTWVLWAPVGYLILIRRPCNGVGTAALVIGLSWGAGFGLLSLSGALPLGPSAAWAGLGSTLFGVIPWLAIVWLLLVYPSGGYAGKAERVIGRVLIGFGLIVATAFAVTSAPMEETGLPSPLAVPALGDLSAVVTGEQSFLVVGAFVLSAIVLVVARWRRSVGVERLQYQWLLMGAVIFSLLITTAGLVLTDDTGYDWLWLLGGAAIPGAIGIAVLRYRLYDIDRIVSRTVTYTVVVGSLAAVYVGGVTWLTSWLPDQSQLVAATTTLAVAALFNPVRKRMQVWVDRRFNRSRCDAQRVMDRFAGSLRDQVNSEEVVDGWVGVVSETMQPSSVAVWVREEITT